jgi:Transmembrane domain of unknown function (DUF3566)
MSRTSEEEPLAPRRSLRKAQTLDEPTTQTAPQPEVETPQRRTGAQVIDRTQTETGPPPPDAARPQPTSFAAAKPQQPTKTSGVRRARLRLVRVDPWSVAKTAFLLSIAFGIMVVVAVFLIMSVMSAAGLWSHVNSSIQTVLNQGGSTSSFNINDYVSTQRVVGIAMLIAVLDVVLITALATLGAFLYNLAASLLGGLEVTLAEDLKR